MKKYYAVTILSAQSLPYGRGSGRLFFEAQNAEHAIERANEVPWVQKEGSIAASALEISRDTCIQELKKSGLKKTSPYIAPEYFKVHAESAGKGQYQHQYLYFAAADAAEAVQRAREVSHIKKDGLAITEVEKITVDEYQLGLARNSTTRGRPTKYYEIRLKCEDERQHKDKTVYMSAISESEAASKVYEMPSFSKGRFTIMDSREISQEDYQIGREEYYQENKKRRKFAPTRLGININKNKEELAPRAQG